MPDFRETRSGGQANITSTDNGDLHSPFTPDSSWNLQQRTVLAIQKMTEALLALWPPKSRQCRDTDTFRRPNYGSRHISKHCLLVPGGARRFSEAGPFWKRVLRRHRCRSISRACLDSSTDGFGFAKPQAGHPPP